jgi:hypothetical protein
MASTNTLEQPSWLPSSIAGRDVQLSESLRLAAVTERSQDITLRTREGDTVTLSVNQDTVAVYGRDGRLTLQRHEDASQDGREIGYAHLVTENREWVGAASEQKITLRIEGDLSREEVRDIRKALHRIHRLLGQSFGIDGDATLKRSNMTGLDTLAGVEVDIQQSRTILAARTTHVSDLRYGANGQPSQSPDRPSARQRPAWQAIAGQAAGIVADTGLDATHFKQPLEDLFGRWSHMLRRRQDPWHHGHLKKIARALGDRLGLGSTESGRRE